MGSKIPPKSLAELIWEVVRLGAKAVWGSRANRVRGMLGRQQAFQVLGLPPTASKEQIKRRYRALAKRHHPDRGGDRHQMQRIIEAYEVLMKD